MPAVLHNLYVEEFDFLSDLCFRMSLTKQANFKQNDSCAECVDANFEGLLLTKDANFNQNQSFAEFFDVHFKQNCSCTEGFAQVLSKTAN